MIEIVYIFDGETHKYRPDFLVRLRSGETLILETKNHDTPKDKAKREFLDEWVRAVKRATRLWRLALGCDEAPEGSRRCNRALKHSRTASRILG